MGPGSAAHRLRAAQRPGHAEEPPGPYPFTSCFSDTVAGLALLAPATRT